MLKKRSKFDVEKPVAKKTAFDFQKYVIGESPKEEAFRFCNLYRRGVVLASGLREDDLACVFYDDGFVKHLTEEEILKGRNSYGVREEDLLERMKVLVEWYIQEDKYQEEMRVYQEEKAMKMEMFRKDLREDLGITEDHPKEALLFETTQKILGSHAERLPLFQETYKLLVALIN